MDPEMNQERRLARAKALTATYAADTGAYYVDAAAYPDRPGTYAVAVVAATSGELYTAGSVRAQDPRQAEELAIALALTNPKCATVLCDSRSAVMNYATNRVSSCASRVCGALPQRTMPVTIKWFPAHMGPVGTGANRNEGADRAARVLTRHSAAPSSPPRPAEGEEEDEEDHVEATPIDTYKEVLAWYREGRRAYPPPHRNLTRREAVLVRQLQVRAIWTPVFAKHV